MAKGRRSSMGGSERAGLRPAPTRGPVEMNAEAEGGIRAVDAGHLRALGETLGEWASVEDDAAYGDLGAGE